MTDNYYNKGEGCVGARLSSSCYPSVFENFFTIKIREIDLPTGLNIVKTISKEFSIRDIQIKEKSTRGDSGH